MKKFLAVLSLCIMLGTEISSPFAAIFAEDVNEEPIVQEESVQEETTEEVTNEDDQSSETLETPEVLEDEELVDEVPEGTTEEVTNEVPDETTEEVTEKVTDEITQLTDESSQSEEPELTEEPTQESENQPEEEINQGPEALEEELTIAENEEIFSQEFQIEIGDTANYVPGEVIVKYKDEIPQESSSKFLARSETFLRNTFSNQSDEVSLIGNDLEIVEELPDSTTVLVEIKDDKTVDETIELLQDDPRIEYVEPNYIHQMFDSVSTLPVNDARKSELNGLDLIDWADAYMIYSGNLKSQNTNVIVGVIDNGVNYNHPDLANSMWSPSSCKKESESVECYHGYDFLYDSPTPLPNISSHGTHVAGIIAAEINNAKGVIGVNPHAKVASLKAGNGAMLTSLAEVKAINFAIENGIKVINASYGSEYESNAEREAIEEFGKAGGLFIAASGNEGIDVDDDSIYPCAYDLDNIICVASVGNSDNLSSFSNYGKTTVDIAAPGESILSTSINEYQSAALLDQDFDTDCTFTGEELSNWIGGSCRPWGNGGYSYKFTNTLTSPGVDLENKENVYLSLAVACNSARGVNLDLEYSNDGINYESGLVISSVGSVGYSYSIGIDDALYTNDFSFRLKIQSPRNGLYCVVDNVAIYQDPYYSENSERYVRMSGTSMATPFVAGLASLVWKLNPNLTNTEVKEIILGTGDDIPSLSPKTVTGKRINVLKTLNAVPIPTLVSPSGLKSSWDGRLERSPIVGEGDIVYEYEILSGDETIAGTTSSTGITISNFVSGNYEWRLKAREGVRTSDIITGYICEKPVLSPVTINGFECSSITGSIILPTDNCSSDYTLVWEDADNNPTDKYAILNSTGELIKKAYLKNLFGEKTDTIDVKYVWDDAPIAFDKQQINGFGGSIITSTTKQTAGNVFNLFGVRDGECGSGTVSLQSVYCNVGTGNLEGNVLSIQAPVSSEGTAFCNVYFIDDEGTIGSGSFTYKFNTKPKTNTNPNTSLNTNSNSSPNGNSPASNTNNTSNKNDSTKTNTPKTDNKQNEQKNNQPKNDIIEVEDPRDLILYSAPTEKTVDFSWYDKSNKDIIRANGYTVEMNNAYEFAHRMGITTINSIDKANMGGELTRIAMAKMLSQYAINVLGLKPDTSKKANFEDVDEALDREYDNGVTLAYQLGIMGVGITNFRPHDTVTRAEFATALSRMLFGLKDGNDAYYSTHINKLFAEGIIANKDPGLQELRGYVMLMLMRSAMNK